MENDLRGKSVLITGGTKGIGLATGLAFGKRGAVCTLTHRWGTADENEIRAQFEAVGAPAPFIVQADASNNDDLAELLNGIKERHDGVDVFVSNVALALLVKSFNSYQKRSLLKSIDYTAWPLFEYSKAIKKTFGRYPRYIIGLSSDGPDSYCANYDFVAGCKAMLETLVRYMNVHLKDENVNVNVVRAGYVLTDSLKATFGNGFEEFAQRSGMTPYEIKPEEVADMVLALCSGLLDGVSGQVLMADRGSAFGGSLLGREQMVGQLSI